MAIEPPENDLRCQPTGLGDPIFLSDKALKGLEKTF
jgi:hypothetical protein